MASTIRSTTQQQIDVEDIQDNLIIQKDGSCSLVMKTNAINFGLLSEEEQDASIYAYAAFLNSLTFTIQILIRSDLKDISGYLKLLEEQSLKQPNQLKKNQILNYKEFIGGLITERNVLEKSFYIVVPFSTLELGVSKSFSAAFLKSSSALPFEKSYIIEKARATLEPKRDHVSRQLARIGVGARQLNTQELIQLLFSMYNASSIQGQKISNTKDYTVPLVQPAYISPKEVSMTDQTTAVPQVTATPTVAVTPPPAPPTTAMPEPAMTPPAPPMVSPVDVTPPTAPMAPSIPAVPSMAVTPPPAPPTMAMSEPVMTPPTSPMVSPVDVTPPPAPMAPSMNPAATMPTPELAIDDAQEAINSAASVLGTTPTPPTTV